jgi:hypothetical protein
VRVRFVRCSKALILAEAGMRCRLHSWARKFVTVSTKRISLEQLRKVLGLQSVHDAAANIIREAPLPVWANLRQRALELDTAINEIRENGFKNFDPVAGAITTSAGNDVDF